MNCVFIGLRLCSQALVTPHTNMTLPILVPIVCLCLLFFFYHNYNVRNHGRMQTKGPTAL
jgi:hypothetical protein